MSSRHFDQESTPLPKDEEKEKQLQARIEEIRRKNKQIEQRQKEIEMDRQMANAYSESATYRTQYTKPSDGTIPTKRIVTSTPREYTKHHREMEHKEKEGYPIDISNQLKRRQRLAQDDRPPPDPVNSFLSDPDRENVQQVQRPRRQHFGINQNSSSYNEKTNLTDHDPNVPSKGSYFQRRGSRGRHRGRGRGSERWRNDDDYNDGSHDHRSSHRNQEYQIWKEERRQIDEARIARQKTSDGEWRREWDKDKVVEEDAKKETIHHFNTSRAARFIITGSGKWDGRTSESPTDYRKDKTFSRDSLRPPNKSFQNRNLHQPSPENKQAFAHEEFSATIPNTDPETLPTHTFVNKSNEKSTPPLSSTNFHPTTQVQSRIIKDASSELKETPQVSYESKQSLDIHESQTYNSKRVPKEGKTPKRPEFSSKQLSKVPDFSEKKSPPKKEEQSTPLKIESSSHTEKVHVNFSKSNVNKKTVTQTKTNRTRTSSIDSQSWEDISDSSSLSEKDDNLGDENTHINSEFDNELKKLPSFEDITQEKTPVKNFSENGAEHNAAAIQTCQENSLVEVELETPVVETKLDEHLSEFFENDNVSNQVHDTENQVLPPYPPEKNEDSSPKIEDEKQEKPEKDHIISPLTLLPPANDETLSLSAETKLSIDDNKIQEKNETDDNVRSSNDSFLQRSENKDVSNESGDLEKSITRHGDNDQDSSFLSSTGVYKVKEPLSDEYSRINETQDLKNDIIKLDESDMNCNSSSSSNKEMASSKLGCSKDIENGSLKRDAMKFSEMTKDMDLESQDFSHKNYLLKSEALEISNQREQSDTDNTAITEAYNTFDGDSTNVDLLSGIDKNKIKTEDKIDMSISPIMGNLADQLSPTKSNNESFEDIGKDQSPATILSFQSLQPHQRNDLAILQDEEVVQNSFSSITASLGKERHAVLISSEDVSEVQQVQEGTEYITSTSEMSNTVTTIANTSTKVNKPTFSKDMPENYQEILQDPSIQENLMTPEAYNTDHKPSTTLEHGSDPPIHPQEEPITLEHQ